MGFNNATERKKFEEREGKGSSLSLSFGAKNAKL